MPDVAWSSTSVRCASPPIRRGRNHLRDGRGLHDGRAGVPRPRPESANRSPSRRRTFSPPSSPGSSCHRGLGSREPPRGSGRPGRQDAPSPGDDPRFSVVFLQVGDEREKGLLASPRTIIVFGWKKSSFSTPLKPGFMLRFKTMSAARLLDAGEHRHPVDRAARVLLRGRVHHVVLAPTTIHGVGPGKVVAMPCRGRRAGIGRQLFRFRASRTFMPRPATGWIGTDPISRRSRDAARSWTKRCA